MRARTHTGEACVGTSGAERPRQKPNSDELYESMAGLACAQDGRSPHPNRCRHARVQIRSQVDRQEHPRVVVLSAGSDNRAYAEFILRFAR